MSIAISLSDTLVVLFRQFMALGIRFDESGHPGLAEACYSVSSVLLTAICFIAFLWI